MKMRLNTLKIQNFVGLSRAEVVFAKPVTMFFGPNNAGKSSIKDALCFALTGKARHAGTFTAAKTLVHKDRRSMSVELGYQLDDLEEISIKKRTAKNISKDVDTNPLLPYVFDGMSFIKLTPKERGRIFSSVLDEGNVEIIKAAIKKHVTFSTILRDEVKATCKNVLDVDQIRDAVIDIRKGLKHQRKAISELVEPEKSDYDIPTDFVQATFEKLRKDDQDIKKVLMEEHAVALAHNQRQENLHKLRKAIGAAQQSLIDIPDDAAELVANLKFKEDLLPFLERMAESRVCPCCGKSVKQKEAIDRGNEIYAAINEETRELGDMSKLIQENDRIKKSIEKLAAQQAELEALKLESPKRDQDKIEEEIDDINNAIAGHETLTANINRFDGALEQYDAMMSKEGTINERIQECDTIDKLLADGGLVKAEIAKAGSTLPINNNLLKAWSIETFEWNTNGDILYLGQPIEAASDSEQYRIAQVMALALAEIGQIGFACVDGYEILCQPHAGQFLEAIESSNLNNVLLFTTKSEANTTKITSDSIGKNANAYGIIKGEVFAI